MCERYVLPTRADAEREFQPQQRWWRFEPSFNVSCGRYVPAVCRHEDLTEGVMMRWGLIPPEAEGKPPAREQPVIASEVLGQTPESRDPWLGSQRCILPCAGYYLWQLTPQRYRQPYFVSLREQAVFGLAALWTRSVSEDDDVIESCAIITMPANDLVAGLLGPAGRMPAILSREDYGTWLRGTPVQAKDVLRTPPGRLMRAHRVSPRVNSLRYDDASLIQPIE